MISCDLNLYPQNWTRAARSALRLGDRQEKYPKDLHLEGVLPNGMRVRLLPSGISKQDPRFSSRAGVALHRIQVLCICGRWIPVGRMGQHFPKHARCKRHEDCVIHKELGHECWLNTHAQLASRARRGRSSRDRMW